MKLPMFIVTVILLFLVEDGDALQQFDETEIFNCYYTIVCDLRKPYEFRRLLLKSGPEVCAEHTQISEQAEIDINNLKYYKHLRVSHPLLEDDSVLIKQAFVWFKEISLIPIECEDTPTFWDSYPDYKCNDTEEVKRQKFNDWITKAGEFWADVCNKDPSGEECSKTEDVAVEFNAIMTQYTADGTCGPDKMSKLGNVPGDVASKAAQDMKPPSFG